MRTFTLLVCAVAASAGLALAEPEPVVLELSGDTAYVDLGARDGVGDGSELELVREIVVTDPVSGRTLRDSFALGTLTVTRAGEQVCQATIEPGLRGRVRPGDRVRLASSARAFVDPWAERVAASRRAGERTFGGMTVVSGDSHASAAATVAEAEAADAAWRSTLGLPPAARAEKWRAFLAARPTSPYGPPVRAEIAQLERQAAALDAAIAAAGAGPTPEAVIDRRAALVNALGELAGHAPGRLWTAAPTRVSPGRPVGLSFTIAKPLVAMPWLYVRPAGAPTYTRIALAADGDTYLRATIPAEQVRGDRLEWYVADGDEPIVGAEHEPRTIAIDRDLTETPPQPGRSQIQTSLDYVDFDGGLDRGFDQYYQAELDFAYRFLTPVHTVRLGFGTMSGIGGPKDIIDDDVNGMCHDDGGNYRCRAVTFSYVYTEFELRPRKQIAVMIRPQAGILSTDSRDMATPGRCADTDDLDDCQFTSSLGLRGRIRFGEELDTNLELSAGFTNDVGTLFEARYRFRARPVIPVQLAVQVTDMPVPEDYGVRLLAEAGYRGMAWVYPSLRLSYQARDIDHVGFSGGVGLNFDW